MKFERLKEILKEEYYNDLLQFLAGQTVTMDGMYEDDFMRWFNKQGVVD